MIILLHSSKTMRSAPTARTQIPALITKAAEIAAYIQGLSPSILQKHMHVSAALAQKTAQVYQEWNTHKDLQTPAIDSFLGDIYSGLQAADLSPQDRDFANEHLRILSGLYGILRPLDGIMPYRLEMGYKLPNKPFNNLYKFWDTGIAGQLPGPEPIINLAAVEYSKAVLPYINADRLVITPKFLTVNPKTNEPNFVVVHAKIARGAFAHWLIKNRVEDPSDVITFSDLNYKYNKKLSTPTEPVFVCKEFGGLGLSVRLTK